MKTIQSRSNPDVQFIALLHDKKNRMRSELYIAEGTRVCATLIQAGNVPKQLYVTEALLPEAQKLVSDTHITVVTGLVMEKISASKTPSGLLGLFPIPSNVSLDNATSGLVLAQISDPGNMGTLIRSCSAMGCSTVVIIEGTDPWSPKAVQASGGAIGKVAIIQTDWHELIKAKGNLKLCAMVVKDGKAPEQIDFTKTLLVVGSEAHGIPDEWVNDCDSTVTIPMPGEMESLNAAIAGSIGLYLAFVERRS